MNFRNTLIVIPALNEAATVGRVVFSLKKAGFKNIAVIDDGSDDKTAEIAEREGAKVLKHLFNLGLGGALATGLEYARRSNCSFLITVDADGQHRVGDVLRLAKAISSGEAEVINGSRFLGDPAAIPPFRRAILRFSNLLTALLFGVRTTDSQSGLRAFSRSVLKKIEIKSLGYEVSSAIFAQIRRHRWAYTEIPITATYTAYSLAKGQPLSNAPNVLLKLLMIGLRR